VTVEICRVLLIEDDDADAFLVDDLLNDSDLKCDLVRVRTIAEASGALDGVDCVLVDLGLPDAYGLSAVTAVLEQNPDLVVVVLTGLSDRARALDAVAAGAQDYLPKDEVTSGLLSRTIRYAIERQRAAEGTRELALAKRRQGENDRLARGLLPKPLVGGREAHVETCYRPAGLEARVGGDFFDAIELDDGQVRAIVGDVCGHGPDEAALGVALRIAWRTLILTGAPEDSILPALDRILRAERATDLFTTVCEMSFAADGTSVRVRLAGHPPPLVVFPAVRYLFGSSGPPLGVFDDARWPAVDHELEPGCSVLMFSDGIYEGHIGDGGVRLGLEGLAELAGGLATTVASGLLLETLVERVQTLHGGPVPDDIAMLLITKAAAP
jgi:serine phosphatase RsbU (regulator of sigma subunit)